MRYSFGAAALFAATVSADFCAEGSTNDGGNYYCQQVNAITYTGVGGSGSYNKITSMDGSSGACSSTPYGYSGNLAPLDEEVSLHFRGPLELKQFAVYTPSGSSASTHSRRAVHEPRHIGNAHGHGHAHMHPQAEKRDAALGDLVTAVINGVKVSWSNTYSGQPANGAAPNNAASGGSNAGASSPASPPAAKPAPYGGGSKASSSSSSSGSASSGNANGQNWNRVAYYNAQNQSADGLVFLNHEGGTGSGVFDYSFGNSLSYASKDGCQGSASPQVLEDCTIPSGTEVVVMSDKKCNGDCGYVRDGTVAYHGFDGPSKAFFFEFGMPDDGTTSADKYNPTNMPAIWMLNAQIPRTLQYGNADCSCWKTGCGEFDIFEVLAPGDKRCKSTLHGNIAGGSSDYFARPTSGTIKAVALLYQDKMHIKILDNSQDFDATMAASLISDIIATTSSQNPQDLVSLFQLSG